MSEFREEAVVGLPVVWV